MSKRTEATAIGDPSNAAKRTIEASTPYIVDVRITGASAILFHAWSCDAIEAKVKAAKGSAAKKTDDVESFVYRNDDGEICFPGEYLRQSIITASKFRQDPRSPRKSAADLFKAAVVTLTPLAPLGVKAWDYEDRRRVVIQRSAITRVRPAMKAGWTCVIRLLVLLPEYVSAQLLQDVITDAGRLVGVGDFRPTFGRFSVTSFDVGLEQ